MKTLTNTVLLLSNTSMWGGKIASLTREMAAAWRKCIWIEWCCAACFLQDFPVSVACCQPRLTRCCSPWGCCVSSERTTGHPYMPTPTSTFSAGLATVFSLPLTTSEKMTVCTQRVCFCSSGAKSSSYFCISKEHELRHQALHWNGFKSSARSIQALSWE